MGRIRWICFGLFAQGLLVPLASAQAAGPDVIVGDLPDVFRWGRLGDITAYSVGTNSCNIGDQPLNWVDATNQHPVIAQNMYRLKTGRFEQIGQSWLKHGFVATNESLCNTCSMPGGSGDHLYPGCSDPYGAGLNGNQPLLGPRSEVNAATGYFPYPPTQPGSPTIIDRRLQVHDADIDPDLNAGALYFVEGEYITDDDAAAGNDNNNASYRTVNVTENVTNTFNVTLTGSTQQLKPAIQAWKDTDPTVDLHTVDVAGDGRIIVAAKATDLFNGFWQYEYAVQNLNSDRSVGSFSVALHNATPVQAAGFHDVDYHSGEPYDLTDWPSSRVSGTLVWATTLYSVNPNANALRWGTLYNFRFRTNSPPISNAVITLGLFKPGSPTSVTVTISGPSPSPQDCNGSSIPDYQDQGNLSLDCDSNGNLDECDLDCNGTMSPTPARSSQTRHWTATATESWTTVRSPSAAPRRAGRSSARRGARRIATATAFPIRAIFPADSIRIATRTVGRIVATSLSGRAAIAITTEGRTSARYRWAAPRRAGHFIARPVAIRIATATACPIAATSSMGRRIVTERKAG